MKGNIKITGKYEDIDLSQFNEDQLHFVFTLINQIKRQENKIAHLEGAQKVYKANKKLMHKMLLVFNYQQNNWNDKIANKAKEILAEVEKVRKELGFRPLNLPKLKVIPKPIPTD